MDSNAILAGIVRVEYGSIIILVDFLIPLFYISAPSVNILLQAYYIGILFFKVFINLLESLFIFVIASILAYIVGN